MEKALNAGALALTPHPYNRLKGGLPMDIAAYIIVFTVGLCSVLLPML